MARSLSENAYEIILNRILSCDIKPGAMINEEQLVEEIGCSRTPIRSALVRLQQEKLLDILPKRGIIVKTVTLEDIKNLYDLRELFEIYALERFGRYMDKTTLLNYLDRFLQFERQTDEEYTRTDIAFHRDIVELTKNSYLCSYYQSSQNLMKRLAWIGLTDNDDRRVVATKEHIAIVEAWICDSIDKASNALHLHIHNGRENCYKCFMRMHSNK